MYIINQIQIYMLIFYYTDKFDFLLFPLELLLKKLLCIIPCNKVANTEETDGFSTSLNVCKIIFLIGHRKNWKCKDKTLKRYK